MHRTSLARRQTPLRERNQASHVQSSYRTEAYATGMHQRTRDMQFSPAPSNLGKNITQACRDFCVRNLEALENHLQACKCRVQSLGRGAEARIRRRKYGHVRREPRKLPTIPTTRALARPWRPKDSDLEAKPSSSV